MSAAADVFSLGVLVYELLTRKQLLPTSNNIQRYRHILAQLPAIPFSQVRPIFSWWLGGFGTGGFGFRLVAKDRANVAKDFPNRFFPNRLFGRPLVGKLSLGTGH